VDHDNETLNDTEAAGIAFALSPCLKKRKNRHWTKEWHKCANTHKSLMGDLELGEPNDYKHFLWLNGQCLMSYT
jgi:hypothetical protein